MLQLQNIRSQLQLLKNVPIPQKTQEQLQQELHLRHYEATFRKSFHSGHIYYIIHLQHINVMHNSNQEKE